MATDFFGFEKTVKTDGQIITGNFASISANGAMALVQSVNASYNRQIISMFEAGSSTLYYLNGNSEGQVTINGAVGKSGFFKNFRDIASSCGAINKLSIDILSGSKCSVGGSGGITFSGGLAEGFNIAYQAGPMAVTEGAQIRCGSMNIR